jgi:AcrR family transcriptional regulator
MEAQTETPGEETRARIIDAAEKLLRRHGPAKTTVVDIAKALGMSHANIYRFFDSKAALLDAIAARWLLRIAEPLWAIARGKAPAPERLAQWVLALHRQKRHKVVEDPEIFATYQAIAQAAHDIVPRHLATLADQIRLILDSGARSGAFKISDMDAAIAAVMDATAAFHHPALVAQRAGLADETRAETVARMLAAALAAGAV